MKAISLESESGGYFSSELPGVGAGTLYRLRLDEAGDFPDPVSRFQPSGPHGPSQVIDPGAYTWHDAAWKGLSLAGQVLYELHVGTFSGDGTYRSAIEHLGKIATLGVSVIELMPVAEFAGRFGWGYDGVDLFAPLHHYGSPDDLRAFVDAAHQHGLGVLLDVVYNHLGPDGNYLREYSETYFKGNTEWGDALNFDGEGSGPVREFFRTNAAYWIAEFHFDGLRLDATQQIFDSSQPHILAEVGSAVREAASGRTTIVIAENEPQNATLVRARERGGYGLDGMWNDDFHHSAMVATTGRDEAYYGGYRGTAQELVSVAKYGFLYQGEWYEWQQGRRGSPALDIPAFRLVNYTENHDQLANGFSGVRLHALVAPGRHRAITALLLLLPQTPMLFQGQEFGASSPFLYFADHQHALGEKVRTGRAEFLAQFVSIATPEATSRLSDPSDERTFLRCKLDWTEQAGPDREPMLCLVRDLIRLRRLDPTIRRANAGIGEAGSAMRLLDGAIWSDRACFLRYFGEQPELDRLIMVNLGPRVHAAPLAEPLVAPPLGALWRPIWSSEHPVYGGCGTSTVDSDDGGWWLPVDCTVVLAPVPRDEAPEAKRHPMSEKEARAEWKVRQAKTAR